VAKGSQVVTVLCILSIVVLFSAGPSGVPTRVEAAPPNSLYSGIGAAADVYEFARNDSVTLTDGRNDTAFTYLGSWLPADYRGYRLQTQITNLRRTENPVPNADLEQYDEPGNNWTLRTSGNEGGLVNSIDRTMGGNPDHCLDIRLKYGRVQQSLSRAYIDNDFAYISAIPPDSLTLEFDIRYSLDISQQSWLTVEVAIECQGSTVGSWSNNTLAYHPPSWEHHSFATAPVNGSVLLSITIEKQSSSLSRINGHIYFDNFRYIIGSDSKPSEVGLTLNGTTVSDGDGNTGSVGIYANPGQKDETPLSSCWTTSQNFQFDSSYDISFHYQYSMYVKGLNASAALTIFSAPVNLDPTWQINYTIPSGRPPAGHTGYSYGVYLHSQWLATGVKDGAGYNYPYTYNGTTRFVKLAEISNPVGKTFSIYASSSNHILQVYLQKSSTTSGPWINVSAGTYFVKNDWLRVMATLRSISATGNYANVSIFYPDQTVWQSADSPAEVSFHDNNDTLTSRSWQIPQISQSCAGSNWTATVSFDNSTQCGMRQQTFSVVIHTNATKSSPSAGARILWGQPVPVNVTWQSSDDASFIADASARVRYVDRYLQVQYVTMSPNGQGAYSTDFATNLMTPNLVAQFYVELFRRDAAHLHHQSGQ
jgi:hypothetical protein